MDDKRDLGIGTALRAAASHPRSSSPPCFSAVYAEAGRRKKRRLRGLRSGFFLAAAMAAGIFIPAFLKADLFLGGQDSYRFLIADLSSRTVSDLSWEDSLFSVESEAGETPLGDFLDDLWNL